MVPARRAAAIAEISRQRLWHWERTGLIEPTVRRELSPRNIVRLYSFDRLVELVVAAAIVRGRDISVQHLRQVIRYLRTKDKYEAPLRELRFAIQGRELFFQHSDGTWEGSRAPRQLVATRLLNLTEVRQRITDSLDRRVEEHGRIERNRKVHGMKPVFAGTRIPVSAVESFIRAGKTDDEILEAFPGLEKVDIEAARGLVRSAS